MSNIDELNEMGYVDLGWANGWRTIPPIIEICMKKVAGEMAHKRRFTQEGQCVERVTCDHCKYTYLVDSSD